MRRIKEHADKGLGQYAEVDDVGSLDERIIIGASGYLVASGAMSRPPQWK